MTSRRSVRTPLRSVAALSLALVTLIAAPAARAQQGGLNILLDTEIDEILHRQNDPVFEAAGLKNVKILLNSDRTLNAAATGSATIFVNTGLIQETKSPSELTGVIAHESGHLAGAHTARSGEMQSAGMKPFLLTLGMGILAAAAGAPDAAAALISSSGYFGTLGALTYSREQESRADQAAITYLESAHMSSAGLVSFFDNFRYQEVFDEARRYPFFQSHPISSQRIELIRRRAEEQKSFKVPDSPQAIADHAIMQAKIAAFTDPPQQTFVKYKENDPSYPARYARAIAYFKQGETAHALTAIDRLLVEQPENPYLWELKGQVLFENGRVKEAEAPHRRSTELKPNAPLLQVNLAQVLLGQEDKTKADEAITHLQRALREDRDNSIAWSLMAQAYDSKGDAGQARLAAAEAQFSVGDLAQARIFALRARQMLTRNSPEWRRATDIVLVAKPTDEDLKALQRENG